MFKNNRFSNLNYKQYEELPYNDEKKVYDDIMTMWDQFLKQNDEKLVFESDYFVHSRNMFEVIRRWDKRILYHYIFHKLEDMCEYKSVAILTFWINTLKPFMVVKTDSPIYSCPNEMFSLFLILTTIKAVHDKYCPNQEFKYPPEERIKDILYDFKYCSLSREAMVAFVETLADTYNVGISFILKKIKTE